MCFRPNLYCACAEAAISEFSSAVASLGWLTPGAATEVSPLYFFLKNLATFFSRQFCGVTPVYFLLKNRRPFLLITVTYYLFHSGVTPLEGVTPAHLFYLSDLVSPLFFVNLPAQFFSFGCHPLEGVTRGGPPPPSNATVPQNSHAASGFGDLDFLYIDILVIGGHLPVFLAISSLHMSRNAYFRTSDQNSDVTITFIHRDFLKESNNLVIRRRFHVFFFTVQI